MTERLTPLGTFCVGTREELFAEAARLVSELPKHARVGLSGGGTPQQWYRWVVEQGAVSREQAARLHWYTSDERFVPLESEESNFGNAARLLLDPLEVPQAQRHPWPVNVDHHSAAVVFNRRFTEAYGPTRAFDLCLLGMGDDGHLASLFPGSPIFGMNVLEPFFGLEVPGKGWRLTITPAGLERCERIVMLVLGESKRRALEDALRKAPDPDLRPVQLMAQFSDQVTWLLDEAAAPEG